MLTVQSDPTTLAFSVSADWCYFDQVSFYPRWFPLLCRNLYSSHSMY